MLSIWVASNDYRDQLNLPGGLTLGLLMCVLGYLEVKGMDRFGSEENVLEILEESVSLYVIAGW